MWKMVQFEINLELNGNHIIQCPNCGHEHCRVVKDGIITDDRWDSRNSNNIYVNSTSTSNYSYYSAYSSTSTQNSSTNYFLFNSWMNASVI